MERYLINDTLRKVIRKNKESMRQISKILDFEVKNIVNKNISISKEHLEKISSFLGKTFKLKKIEFSFSKNLGKYAFNHPIRNFKKSMKLAELFGIMLGDGNINRNRIRICFDKRHLEYIEYVYDLFYKLFGIKLKKQIMLTTNQAYLYCYNKLLIKKFEKLGLLSGSKIKNKQGIPDWIKEDKKFSKASIKGLIDTDGCIYQCKRENQTYIKFTNFNITLLADFLELTRKLQYNFVKANKNNKALYRKSEVARFIKDIKPFRRYGDMG